MHGGGVDVLEPSEKFENQGFRLTLATDETDPEYQRVWRALALEAIRIAAGLRNL